MDWHLKAILQSVFSHLPSGHHVNYLFQRHVTRSFPIDENSFQDIVTWSEPHIDAIRRHHPLPLSRLQFYEFGAGYHLILPLTYYAFGVERQTIVDINQLIRPELINESIVKFRELDIALHLPRRPSRLVDERCLIPSLKALYGIEYRAPCDARATGLPEGSVDCITSTSTLEHISPTDIQAILRECHRILRPDGMMTAMVDYLDHYSFLTKTSRATTSCVTPIQLGKCSTQAFTFRIGSAIRTTLLFSRLAASELSRAGGARGRRLTWKRFSRYPSTGSSPGTNCKI